MQANLPQQGDNLSRRAYRGLAIFIVVLGVCLFLPALTLAWWRAWVYLAVFAVATLAITAYFLKHDPELVAHRMSAGPTAEKEPRQKLIQGLLGAVLLLLFIVPGLDHLFGWSRVPDWLAILGDIAVALSFWIIYRTFQENSYAASIVEIREGQRVVASGPYAIVRHPMYAGAVLLFVGTPLALGSWWALILAALAIAGLVWRLLDEEAFLVDHLPGYAEYRRQNRYRLIPLVW